MFESNDRTAEAQCILRMLIWVRDEIERGLKCDEAAATVTQAIEMIGAHFPEAHADVVERIADDPWRTLYVNH
jgi:hypothetical protein